MNLQLRPGRGNPGPYLRYLTARRHVSTLVVDFAAPLAPPQQPAVQPAEDGQHDDYRYDRPDEVPTDVAGEATNRRRDAACVTRPSSDSPGIYAAVPSTVCRSTSRSMA